MSITVTAPRIALKSEGFSEEQALVILGQILSTQLGGRT